MNWQDYIFITNLKQPYEEYFDEESAFNRVVVHQTGTSSILGELSSSNIPYNYYVDHTPLKDSGGRVEVFRTGEDINFVDDYNAPISQSVHVGVAGLFNHPRWVMGAGDPSSSQRKAVSGIWMYLKGELGIRDESGLYGHYHFGDPSCPGSALETWIDMVRSSVHKQIDYKKLVDIQYVLKKLGYGKEINGIYDDYFKNSVLNFSVDYKSYGLSQNGSVDDLKMDIIELVWAAFQKGKILSSSRLYEEVDPCIEEEVNNDSSEG